MKRRRTWAATRSPSPTGRRSRGPWRSVLARCSVQETAEAVGGRVTGDPGTVWDGAAIDSRAVHGGDTGDRGELFFAFAGEQTDGHRFVADAFARGAAAAM